MDKELIKQRFARAASTYSREATAQQRVAEGLARMVHDYVPEAWHRCVWEIGCGTGLFTKAYLLQHRPGEMWLNDICPEMETCLAPLLSSNIHFFAADAERVSAPDNVSLIVSCSALQWFDSPLVFLQRCHNFLLPRGYMAIAIFGQDNLKEIRSLTGTGLSYRTMEEWRHELSAMGFNVLKAKEEKITVKLPSPVDVLRHLRQTGVSGIRRQIWTKDRLTAFSREYISRYGTPDGHVSLTYHPIYLIFETKKTEQ